MQLNIVEIIGPPGIGKSTVYKSLCKTWKPNSNWTYPEILLSDKQPKITDVSKWVEFQAKRLFGKKITKKVNQNQGLKFINAFPQLANFYWSYLSSDSTSNSTEIDKSFRSAHLLFSDFCTYQAIADTPSTKPCLVNEGLLQKSFLLNENEDYVTELVDSYFKLIPIPRAIIYLNSVNRDVIIQRLINRSKVIATHQGKDSNQLLYDIELWQMYLNKIAGKAIELKIPVIKVEGESPINETVKNLQAQLDQLKNF